MSLSDDEDETICPLCVEEMDLSDKNFLPCPCGYRVCIWCWHHIRENMNGLCPACRTPYNPDPHAFSAVDRQEIIRKNKERKQKERNDKKVTDRPGPAAPTSGSSVAIVDRRQLHNYRVVQRNLIYIVGIPLGMANEELLRKSEYLGQYGKIGKVVVHRNHTATQTTVSAYVTFVYKEDAKAAIQSLEGYWVDGHLIRASFGTTKYCNNFIRGVPCNNPDCVYLHELGDDEDRFTKEEIQAGHSKLVPVPGRDQTIITGNGGPSGTGKKPSGEPVFPPPVFIQDINPTSRPVPVKEKSSYWPSPGDDNDEDSEPVNETDRDDDILQKTYEAARFESSDASTTSASNELSKFESLTTSSRTDFRTAVVSDAPINSNSNSNSNGALANEYNAVVATEEKVRFNSNAIENKFDPNASVGKSFNTFSTNSINGATTIDSEVAVGSSDLGVGSTWNGGSVKVASIADTAAVTSVATTAKRTEAIQNPTNSLTSFNGITRCAVFPVPTSSFSVSIWSVIVNASSTDLKVDPYGKLLLPISEFLDLTIPPVDAVCNAPWPRPLVYYSRRQANLNNGITDA